METTKEEQRTEFKQFDTRRIPESEYQKYGIMPSAIESELKAMSYGFKSPHLVDIAPNIEGVSYPMQARLSLAEQPDGSLKFIPYPWQQQVDLDKPFHGVMLPADVKENLLATGNGGRIVELEPHAPGVKVPSLISIDKITNRLEAVPVEKLNISKNLKGIELSDEQMQAIKQGKKILAEGMTTKSSIGTDSPKMFDAYIQFNAARGQYDFSYEGLDRNRYRQDTGQQQKQKNGQQGKIRIPTTLLGVDLTEAQKGYLREGKATYVKGMVKNAEDGPFNAWVKPDYEKGKLSFLPFNPDKARQKNTGESKESLKQDGQKPAGQQQKAAFKKPVKKSTGPRM